jgi:Bacterial regulatory proteins, luxR family
MLAAGTPLRSQQGRLEFHPPISAERLERLLLAGRGRPRSARTAARPGETEPAIGADRPPAKGGSEESASAVLGVSKATLHTHLGRVYEHLGVHNRAALVALLARHGFDVAPGDGGEKI